MIQGILTNIWDYGSIVNITIKTEDKESGTDYFEIPCEKRMFDRMFDDYGLKMIGKSVSVDKDNNIYFN